MKNQITVTEQGKKNEGGWLDLDKKKIPYTIGRRKGTATMGIIVLWDEEMDATNVPEYIADHIRATGEFPHPDELSPCRGAIQLYSSEDTTKGDFWGVLGRDHELDWEFSNAQEMVEGYYLLKDLFNLITEWREWVKVYYDLNPRMTDHELIRTIFGPEKVPFHQKVKDLVFKLKRLNT